MIRSRVNEQFFIEGSFTMGELLVIGVLGWVGYSLYSDGKRTGSRKGFNVGVHKGRKRR